MYRILFTHHFKRQLKKLIKHDVELKQKLIDQIKSFDPNHNISIGKGIFKLRIAGVKKGKSSGYRTYILIMEMEAILTPLCIYSKKDLESLKAKELIKHLNAVQDELEQWL